MKNYIFAFASEKGPMLFARVSLKLSYKSALVIWTSTYLLLVSP